LEEGGGGETWFPEISNGRLKNMMAKARVREAEAIRNPIFSEGGFGYMLMLRKASKSILYTT